MSEHDPAPAAPATDLAGPQAMTPSEAFVETLAANGVSDMFGIMPFVIFVGLTAVFAATAVHLRP